MALSPSFLQALEVLQLGAVDLVAQIEAECERNETLRVANSPRLVRGDSERRHEFLERVEARPPDLLEHLRHELGLLDVTESLQARVLELAGRLDAQGYLGEIEGELVDRLGRDGLDEALAILHSLPPRGLGARGPIDAMLLQLEDDDPDRPAIEAILRGGLAELARGENCAVADRLGIDTDELTGLLSRIRRLDPRPGARFCRAAPTPRLPDLVLRSDGGRLVVELADGSLPALSIDDRIARIAADRSVPTSTRRRIAVQVGRARGLMRAVQQRGETLLRIARLALASQREFVRRGQSGIRRLRMQDVAAELGLHSSTVSRAVRDKTIWTSFGLVTLREFFEVGGSGPTLSEREALTEAIRACLAADDRSTDAAIADRLAARGLVVARRTVAKYRALLGVKRRSRPGRDADSGT